MTDDAKQVAKFVGAIATVIAIVFAGAMGGCPVYNVWHAQKAGEAQLAEATLNRKIKVQDAEAHREAAKHLADAEVTRAKGAAEANKIIGASLHGNDAYLRYLWIQTLSEKEGRDKEVIYVPTEANLPILEASRLPKPAPTPAAKASE